MSNYRTRATRSAHMARHFAGRRGAGVHRGQGKWDRVERELDRETVDDAGQADSDALLAMAEAEDAEEEAIEAAYAARRSARRRVREPNDGYE